MIQSSGISNGQLGSTWNDGTPPEVAGGVPAEPASAPDVITANRADNNATFLRNRGEFQGNWQGFSTYDLTAADVIPTARSVAVGDFDLDGKTDVAVLGEPGELAVFFHDGGTPVPYPSTPDLVITAGIPTPAFHVAAADVDGDGDVDFVVGEGGSPGPPVVNVLWNDRVRGVR